jgi:hypothetical protein
VDALQVPTPPGPQAACTSATDTSLDRSLVCPLAPRRVMSPLPLIGVQSTPARAIEGDAGCCGTLEFAVADDRPCSRPLSRRRPPDLSRVRLHWRTREPPATADRDLSKQMPNFKSDSRAKKTVGADKSSISARKIIIISKQRPIYAFIQIGWTAACKLRNFFLLAFVCWLCSLDRHSCPRLRSVDDTRAARSRLSCLPPHRAELCRARALCTVPFAALWSHLGVGARDPGLGRRRGQATSTHAQVGCTDTIGRLAISLSSAERHHGRPVGRDITMRKFRSGVVRAFAGLVLGSLALRSRASVALSSLLRYHSVCLV